MKFLNRFTGKKLCPLEVPVLQSNKPSLGLLGIGPSVRWISALAVLRGREPIGFLGKMVCGNRSSPSQRRNYSKIQPAVQNLSLPTMRQRSPRPVESGHRKRKHDEEASSSRRRDSSRKRKRRRAPGGDGTRPWTFSPRDLSAYKSNRFPPIELFGILIAYISCPLVLMIRVF